MSEIFLVLSSSQEPFLLVLYIEKQSFSQKLSFLLITQFNNPGHSHDKAAKAKKKKKLTGIPPKDLLFLVSLDRKVTFLSKCSITVIMAHNMPNAALKAARWGKMESLPQFPVVYFLFF